LTARACELSQWKDAACLDALAAAYAETGDFPKEHDVIAIPFGGCRPFVAFRSARGFPAMNATFRGAKGDYVLELTNRAKKGSQRTKAGIYFGPATEPEKDWALRLRQ
jgi:hypothetical protein